MGIIIKPLVTEKMTVITKGQFFFCHRAHQSRSRIASSVSMGMPNHFKM